MKKFIIALACFTVIFFLAESPSFSKADELVIVGEAYIIYEYHNSTYSGLFDIYSYDYPEVLYTYGDGSFYFSSPTLGNQLLFFLREDGPLFDVLTVLGTNSAQQIYIPTLTQSQTFIRDNRIINAYGDYGDYINSLPDNIRPHEPNVWDHFYDLFELIFGYRPADDSIWGILRDFFEGDHSENTDIIFPTLTPTPTPAPTPTPIPVQTIFVPDGNGNTTIIYQYPDPTSGVITQSPYNPNDNYNVQVNCNCDGNDNTPLGTYNPQDPYTYDASLFWADGFGVQMSDNPLTVTDDQQTMLKGEADQYLDSAAVVSNSFNILPAKWIALVGLLGGILIIAGLIRTFLGG